MASIPALVEPSVLRWARESVGLTPVAAARKIGVADDRVAAWEAGEVSPTIAQLRAAATTYKRPLGVFFLAEPPTEFDAMRDFRRLPSVAAGEWSPELHGEYRRARVQRENSLELADVEDEPPATTWDPGQAPASNDAVAALGRATLLRNAPLALPTAASTPYDHLNAWSAALEEAGVLVLATSGGSVAVREMRAFSLYYEVMPVIVVNGSDWPRGRLFSLLHEYAHLLLHTSGLCDAVSDTRSTTPNRRLEARCNAIAAAMLMPADAVLARPEVRERVDRPDDWSYSALRSAASPFGASAEAFLRRLTTLGLATSAYYELRRDEFQAAYESEEASTRVGGGNWYRNTARDLGKGYVRRIADAHRRRVIDSYTAASYLDVKVSQISRLAEAAALKAS